MKRILFIILTALTLLSACNKDNEDVEIELPPYSGEKIPMTVGTNTFTVSLFDNTTARAFSNLLPMTITMEDVNSNEKFHRLPQNLPGTAINPGTIHTGDLMAYGGNGLVLFYKTFSTSYSYARIGTVDNPSGLQAVLGSGNATITFGNTSQSEEYTLTYNINGATSGSAPESVTLENGSNIILNDGTGISRTGYTFTGWNTQANGTGTDYAAGSNYTLTANATLYAKWQTAQTTNYTLTYNTNGATSGSTPTPVTEVSGSTIMLNNGTGFSRNGYTFAGWNTQTDGSGTNYPASSNYTITGNITLYAKWDAVTQSNNIRIKVGSNTFNATLADNATARAFRDLLPMTVNMSELNGNEKYYYLPGNLPTASYSPGTIQNGDIMLYGSNCLVLFYLTFQSGYSYTRIGKVDNPSGLQSALGSGGVTVTYEIAQ
ncbi:MAG: cyclophilin-like fold protein [Oscillospiraceae bacterium]|nr:cyclophilin-like fold protein [Oscillospiraceae bacterium]